MFTLECKMNEYNLKSAAHILTPTFEHAGGNSGVFTNTGPFPFGGPGPRRKRRKFDEVDRKVYHEELYLINYFSIVVFTEIVKNHMEP